MTDRGRITLPDVIYLLIGVVLIGILYPVFKSGFISNRGSMSTGSQYLWLLVLPIALLMLLGLAFRKATRGAR